MNPATPAGHLARLIEHLVPGEARLRRRQPALFESGTERASEQPPVFAETPASPASAPLPAVAGQAFSPRPKHEPEPQALAPAPRAPLAPPRIDPTVRAPASVPTSHHLPASAPAPQRSAADAAKESSPSRAAAAVAAQPMAAKGAANATALEPPPAGRARALDAPAVAPREAQLRGPQHGNPPPPAPATSRPLPTTRADVRRQAAAMASHPAAPAALPPAPAPISVSIGRIEVRATPAGAHPPQQAPRNAQRLSLDQYLRDRGETGRGSR